jgi:hypothetical protein
MTDNDKRPASGDRRPRKPGSQRPSGSGGPKSGASRSGAPGPGAPRSGVPKSDASRSSTPRDGERRSTPRTGGPRRDDGTRDGGRPRRDDAPRGARPQQGERAGRPSAPRRPFADRGTPRPPRDDDRENAPRHDDPAVDEDATPSELDRSAWRELKALTKENAEWVAGHLVMASRVVDEEPERAHKHALAAARRAGRIPVVRETVGITAYLLGDFALALRELRTYRRLSGSNDQVPMMVDCERGLGRPGKALELAGEVNRAELSAPIAVELAIARSGARLDLGELELALQELEIPQLNPNLAYSYSPALFDSYATILSLMGKEDEAQKWGELANRAAEALGTSGDDEDDEVVVVDMPLEGEGV